MKELITIISLFSLVTLFSEVHIMEISLKDTSGVVFLRDSLENNIKDQQSQHYNFEQVEFLESQKSQNSLEVKNKFQTNGDNIKLNEESTRLEIVNFPNNYNLETVTMFYLEEDSQVKIDFYNSLGEVVANLVNGKIKKGRHITKYDGVSLKSGTYYIRLEVNGEIKDLKKLILLL
ncbi:MAG: T9SS type A sorting domain-containing protein [Candidatus Delongbacteria bacterium]|nr:T9SS type A sorting domain-containing protein [Candidatus Delongbacteria bacterium]MBN2834015.1 T9SS type A sorting domain-containing protein [Candidatus Delongbacteria bacterium]